MDSASSLFFKPITFASSSSDCDACILHDPINMQGDLLSQFLMNMIKIIIFLRSLFSSFMVKNRKLVFDREPIACRRSRLECRYFGNPNACLVGKESLM